MSNAVFQERICMAWIINRSLGYALRVQVVVTSIIMIFVLLFSGISESISAFLGGFVSFISSASYAIIVSRHRGYTANEAVRTALRAEAVKIFLSIVLLWFVFRFYENVNPVAFIGTFIMVVLANSFGLLAGEEAKKLNNFK